MCQWTLSWLAATATPQPSGRPTRSRLRGLPPVLFRVSSASPRGSPPLALAASAWSRRRRWQAAAEPAAAMDESSLLDLLECSVCLERLDTTAKVLPCQHTFCRRCLESIVSSRHELRCPECRILVGCGVDELPANILLVRLLDGIRQRPRATGGASGSPISAAPSTRAGGRGGGAPGPSAGTRTGCLVATSVSQLPYGKALYTYEGKEPGDLKFNKGDIIILRRKVDENWYHGELNGNHGFFPASYIQCIKPLPQAPPQGKALYDFEIKDKDQDKDCLTFTKDEILTVIRRVDDNWAEGMLGDKIGIFPILYVELNESAKQLIEMDKTCSATASGCDVLLTTEPAAVAAASAVGLAPCSTLTSSGAAGAAQRQAEGKKNAKKRHSFTALSMTHKSSQATSNRHSMEISAPVLISSSDPRAAARIGELTHLSSSAPAQDSSLIGTATVAAPRTSAIIGDQGTSPKVQLPLNIYLALYAYKPQKNDELELRKGEMYRVIEKCQDGWFKGTSLRSGMSGVFPGNYVTPVSRVPVGAGQPRNSGAGGVPAAKGAPGAIHPVGAGHTNAATAVRPVVPITAPQTHPQLQAASPQLNNCLRYSAQQPASQTRNAMQMGMCTVPLGPVPIPDCTSQQLNIPSQLLPYPALFLKNAPNSHAQSWYICSLPMFHLVPLQKEKKSGLLKLLAGASTKKKSRSPPSVSPTHDPQAAIEGVLQGAVGPELSSLSSHGRAGSCPIESEMQGAMGLEPLHRKTGSLDLNFSIPSPARQPLSSMAAIRPEPKPLPRERYRVVVPYPPQSEAEIELKEGDIVFVHKKREDGWYKGTLQRNGRTGLFPGSFVESF
uniref:RING-type E3 ubiquitin transferase n=1 Tax=Amazona collaria TaxID=241587 RepID=A0A8B9FBR1_9PSIT